MGSAGASLAGKNSARTGKKGAERAHSGCDGAGARKEAARNAVCTGHWDRFLECAAEKHARPAATALDRGINAHELRFDHGHVVAELRSDAADFDLIAAAHAVKRGVALNAPRIAASALYGVDAANVQIDDYQFAISLDRHRIGDVGAAPKIGRHLAANPECRVQINTRRLGRLRHARRPRCPGNRWADLVARGLPWLLPS